MLSGDDLTIALFFVGTAISIAGTAMSAAGWRHPVLIGTMFSLAGICAVVGVAWPLLKTISPVATALVNQVATNPVAWFVVLILGMTASILLPRRRVRISSPVMSHIPVASPASAPVEALTQPQRKGFVDVSPFYLIDLYKDKTTVLGDAAAAKYIGKWMKATFKVYDVSQYTGTILIQSVLSSEIGSMRYLSARFIAESSENVSLIAKNTTITVQGEIVSITSDRVTLEKCELVETSPSR